MARPKKEEMGKARQALIDAFWGLLEEMPYEQISVRILSARAGVNHNTFYRHFDNIDNLAKLALIESIPQELPSYLRGYAEEHSSALLIFFDEDRFQSYAHHARLFIMSDSLYLNHVLQEELKQVWLTYLEISEEDLTPEEELKIAFISGGILSGIRANGGEANSTLIGGLLSDPMIDAVLNSLFVIQKAHKKMGANIGDD